MITSNYQVDGDIYSYADKFFCDSQDDKPTNADAKDGLINGAILEETDTGKTYIFDKKANKWTEKAAGGGGGGGSTTLAGLTDVDISNPSDGQTLVYDAASSKWVNGSGGGGVLVCNMDDNTFNLDKTYAEITAAIFAVIKSQSIEDPGVTMVSPIVAYGYNGEAYIVATVNELYLCSDPDDYPQLDR